MCAARLVYCAPTLCNALAALWMAANAAFFVFAVAALVVMATLGVRGQILLCNILKMQPQLRGAASLLFYKRTVNRQYIFDDLPLLHVFGSKHFTPSRQGCRQYQAVVIRISVFLRQG